MWRLGTWNRRGINRKEYELIENFKKSIKELLAEMETKNKGAGIIITR